MIFIRCKISYPLLLLNLIYSKWKYILSWLISVNMNSSITKGLRTLHVYWLLSILGGVNQHFTQEPSNPSYFINGSDANLVWDYADPQNDIQSIIYSVLVNGELVEMLVNDSLGVQEHTRIPPSYKGRVKIERRATLVIENINPRDNTEFSMWTQGRPKRLRVQCSLLWQVHITNITINNQTEIKCIQLMSHISEIWRK